MIGKCDECGLDEVEIMLVTKKESNIDDSNNPSKSQ